MKKFLFLFAVILPILFLSCSKQTKDEPSQTQKDDFDYSIYKVCGKQYKRQLDSEIDKGNYDIFKFQSNGKCDVDYYFNNIYSGDGIYDYYYWMVGDSIFIDCSPKRDYKYIKGIYYDDHIVLDNFNMTLVFIKKVGANAPTFFMN